MTRIADRHEQFAALHAQGCFVIPNPWDAGSARVMAGLGAKALATTSAGFAFTLGRPDMGGVTREESLLHAQAILAATDLPVSADLENGFSDDPDGVAETVLLAAEIGLSGCSIEDTVMVEAHPAYEFGLAVERVKAGASAARATGRPFVFCARADGILTGAYETEEAVRRIQAFEAAGADLVYVPMPPGPEDLRRIVDSVRVPVNALAAGRFAALSLADFAELGVRRVSTGSAIARLTHAALAGSVRAMLDEGDFSPLQGGMPAAETDRLLLAGSSSPVAGT